MALSNQNRDKTPYELGQYPRPAVTVDLVVLTILDADLKVLLVQRGEAPFQHQLALPGGFVRVGDAETDLGEDLEAAAARELSEETGLSPSAVYLRQLGAFGRADRDPRTRVITVAYYALVRPDLAPFVEAGGDAESASWYSMSEIELGGLAFDHNEILVATADHVRGAIDRSDIAFELAAPTFSISELRSIYEVIKGAPLDPGNFRRRFLRMVSDGVLEEAPGKRVTGTKPAKVYRFVR